MPLDPINIQKALERHKRRQARLPFYARINQPPKGVHLNGQHRRPSPQAHSDPANGAGGSAGTDLTGTPASIIPGYTTYISTYTWEPARPDPEPPAIPYAGIRAGEIIGYRAWLVVDELKLCSLTRRFIWEPGKVVEGDVTKIARRHFSPLGEPKFTYEGVYGFKTGSLGGEMWCDIYIIRSMALPEVIRIGNLTSPIRIWGMATGTISMWGEVVEHERGYRSQFAKVRSIDAAYGKVQIEDLSRVYGV